MAFTWTQQSEKVSKNQIEELRNNRKYGFNQLAIKSGVNVKSLNEIINGKAKKVNPFHLKKLARALNVDYKEFYKIVEYLDEDEKIVPNAEITFNFKRVPVFENISAGYGAAESDILEYISLPNYQGTFTGDIFAVQVHGDSMENTIEDKSIVFINK